MSAPPKKIKLSYKHDIGAVHISIYRQGWATVGKEREDRRSNKSSLSFYCWAVREHLADCHIFCEALSLAVITVLVSVFGYIKIDFVH